MDFLHLEEFEAWREKEIDVEKCFFGVNATEMEREREREMPLKTSWSYAILLLMCNPAGR